MRTEREQEIESTQLLISEIFNQVGAFDAIKDVALKILNIDIHHDSQFWHDIEELIINRILEEEEE